MVLPLDSTVFGVAGSVEVGRDFLCDSPANVGEILTALVGERLRNELDDVIVNGNGTTQPQGIFTIGGVAAIVAANAAAGPPTLADYTNCMFGVAKQYRDKTLGCCFISNDTSYSRSRQIAVDPTAAADQRPVLANVDSFSNYKSLGWPHRIENNLGNRSACFVALKKYRIYRRLGLEIRFETGGTTLARRNMVLLVFRGRYAGRLLDINAAARWTNGQA